MNSPRNAPQSVKIIAGHWRGTKLPVLLREGVRPTSNRVRETLFSWLQFSIEGSHCLDMFTGSGALGFEAVSRGASSATLLDNDLEIISLLNEQIRRLGTTNIITHCTDSLRYIEQSDNKFDFIFIDPPFSKYNLENILDKISLSQTLKGNTAIYVETSIGGLPTQLPFNWQWQRQSKAGDVEYGLIKTS
ncbi:MAG: 16S rRNA (guanine(966)-N(2))-methyltransferase RsmD [Pseudomonadota bacterium]